MTTPAPSYLVGLIGAGIGSSVTPALHESEADAAGLRYLYRTIDIDVLGYGVDATVELIRRAGDLGYDALNITHPCKLAAIDALDEVSPDVALLGSVNTVLFRDGRAIGHNTDHSGFARGLRDGLAGRPRDAVLLVGAGGAGAAIAYALLSAGVRRLEIADAAPTRCTATPSRNTAPARCAAVTSARRRRRRPVATAATPQAPRRRPRESPCMPSAPLRRTRRRGASPAFGSAPRAAACRP